MASHSSTLAWKIPWTEEPGRLQSLGSLRVGYNWATSLSIFTFMHWRRKWQPTPMFLPGESQGRGSLVGCRLRGRTESTWMKQLSSSYCRADERQEMEAWHTLKHHWAEPSKSTLHKIIIHRNYFAKIENILFLCFRVQGKREVI